MISRIKNLFAIKEFTGRHMLGVLFLFFGTIISVNLLLAWFAVDSWSGLVAKNGYVESINFDAKQREMDRQKLLGWKSQLKLNGGHVIFSLKSADGVPLQGMKIKATIGRPTTETQDKKLAFHEGNKGEYIAAVTLDKGQWDVAIIATNAKNDRYRKLYRLVNEPRK